MFQILVLNGENMSRTTLGNKKIYFCMILPLKCSFGIGYGIGRKYLNLGFGFGIGIGPKPK